MTGTVRANFFFPAGDPPRGVPGTLPFLKLASTCSARLRDVLSLFLGSSAGEVTCLFQSLQHLESGASSQPQATPTWARATCRLAVPKPLRATCRARVNSFVLRAASTGAPSQQGASLRMLKGPPSSTPAPLPTLLPFPTLR